MTKTQNDIASHFAQTARSYKTAAGADDVDTMIELEISGYAPNDKTLSAALNKAVASGSETAMIHLFGQGAKATTITQETVAAAHEQGNSMTVGLLNYVQEHKTLPANYSLKPAPKTIAVKA